MIPLFPFIWYIGFPSVTSYNEISKFLHFMSNLTKLLLWKSDCQRYLEERSKLLNDEFWYYSVLL